MEYVAIFEGKTFQVLGDTWTAHVESTPGASARSTDRLCFLLELRSTRDVTPRRLKLWASDAGIQVENHIPKLYESVQLWLQSGEVEAEIDCFQ